MSSALPFWVVILVGALSGVIGSVLGPSLTRLIARSDRALAVRRAWAKIKLLTVFGLGEAPFASDSMDPPFFYLTPPNSWRFHMYDMHQINHGVEESIDLMMLQPRRSSWARDWLYNWHFVLQPQAQYLHMRMHIVQRMTPGDSEHYAVERQKWDKDNDAYERRVRKVMSAFSIWSIGQISRPSILMWLANRKVVQNHRSFWDHQPADFAVVSADPRALCDCWDKYQSATADAEAAQAEWEDEQRQGPTTDGEVPVPPVSSDA